MGDKWETSVNSCAPRHRVRDKCGTQVEDMCKLMRPKAPRVGEGDKCKLIRPKEPRVGDKGETSVGDKWETSVNSCGPRNPEWETSVGNKCGRQVWETSVGNKCGRQV